MKYKVGDLIKIKESLSNVSWYINIEFTIANINEKEGLIYIDCEDIEKYPFFGEYKFIHESLVELVMKKDYDI